jgi:hypothetical protein
MPVARRPPEYHYSTGKYETVQHFDEPTRAKDCVVDATGTDGFFGLDLRSAT